MSFLQQNNPKLQPLLLEGFKIPAPDVDNKYKYRTYCYLCKEYVSEFGRQLNVHKEVPDVVETLDHPVRSNERRQAIKLLAARGTSIRNFNLNLIHGVLVPGRRPPTKSFEGRLLKNIPQPYGRCGNCCQVFPTTTIRHHICNKSQHSERRNTVRKFSKDVAANSVK